MNSTLAPSEQLLNQNAGVVPMVQKKQRQVRVDGDVADMADRLAALQDPPQTTPGFLSNLLRPILRKELGKALDKAKRQLDAPTDDE